ncbi:major facilitator superfamily domain-containing protein [Pseudoneurospora amorphoporcata]|uniref:Major facilitator superfamily domain-containing protein n=1 Tax=Pseudoneurospora amorphoporcata TaxID=241081 RepID=A0AAN6P117_9PEZI|nr:major facilitator superfamily domain-containing protein [Pseudoneurospora amorphoporcata]
MTNSSFPRCPPGTDTDVNTKAGLGRTLDDDPALKPAVPTTTDYQTITKPPPTANPNSDTKSKMPETAASRKAQVVPLLGGHDGPDASSSRSSNENQHTSIDSLTALTPGVVIPANQHHDATSFSDEDNFTTGKYALRSWLTVVGAWLAIFSSFGLLTVLSICQNYVSGDNEQVVASISEGTFAWVFSLYFVVSLGLGMYVETWAILLAFGILSGLTSTFLFIPSLVTIHQFFGRSPQYYTFATSLATTAGPTAGIVFPYATRNLFHEVSWPWTIRTLGLICFFLAVIANFLTRSPPSVRSPAPSVPTSPTLSLSGNGKKSRAPSSPGSSASSASSASTASANSTTPMVAGLSTSASPSTKATSHNTLKAIGSFHPSLTPFFSRSYALLFLSLLLIHLSIYTTTTFYSATSLYSQGYSQSFTFRTTTLVVNLSSIAGRLLAGLLASGFPFGGGVQSQSQSQSVSSQVNRRRRITFSGMGPFNTTILFSLLATLVLLAAWLPPTRHPGRTGMSPSSFTAFAVLFGLSSGAVLGLEPVLVARICGSNNNNGSQFGQCFGTLYTLVSMASVSGIPIGSHLVSACQGRFGGLVVFVGVSFGVGMLGLLLVRRRTVVSEQDDKTAKGQGVTVA